MKALRRITRVTYKDRVSNEAVIKITVLLIWTRYKCGCDYDGMEEKMTIAKTNRAIFNPLEKTTRKAEKTLDRYMNETWPQIHRLS